MESASNMRALIDMMMNSVVPLVVLRGMTIVYANDAAYRVLGLDPGVTVIGASALQFVHPSERDEVAESMKRILSEGSPVRNIPRWVVGGEQKPMRLLNTAVAVEWEGEPAVALTFVQANAADGRHASDHDQPREPDQQRAESLESLSPRERQIAFLVAQGLNVQHIASLLQIQRETVRTHIKSVYRKTETHTRVELTRLVLGMPRHGQLPDRESPPCGQAASKPASPGT